MNKTLNLPDSKPLPNFGNNTPVPHVFVDDEAFAMSHHVIRPYSRQNLDNKKRVFNYRLSRARRFVECAFGILANKWRVFHTSIFFIHILLKKLFWLPVCCTILFE